MAGRDGDRTLPPANAGPLLAWLLETLKPMSRTRVKELLAHGRIAVNGEATTQFDHPLREGDRVTIGSRKEEAPQVAIVYQDEDLVAIDKPTGLLSVATASEREDTAFTRLNAFLQSRQEGRAFVVHRLDRETSGLLLFARSMEIRDRLQASWESVEKTYLAVVEGKPDPVEGVVTNYLTEGRDLRVRASDRPREGARQAVTRYRLVSTRAQFSLMEVMLETGRKHQIRVHLAGLGCPVIGDSNYRATTNPAGGLGLHAWRMAFDHPRTKQRMEIEAKFPARLRNVAGAE
jgi:23S rRNA pseudouridine1911/1915/1917 synthase